MRKSGRGQLPPESRATIAGRRANWQTVRRAVITQRLHPSEAISVVARETIASDGIAWDSVAWDSIAWTRPAAVPFDLNGPADRPFTPPPADFTERAIFDLLRDVAAPEPDAIAIVGSNEHLTYAAMLEQIRRVAHHVARTVPASGAVATLLPNSPSGFTAMLACVVAARVCIVLDPAHPRERNATILQDARPAAILLPDDDGRAADGAIPEGPVRLSLKAALSTAAPADWLPPAALGPDAAALVHYTSGSTGRPKGIVISTRAALRRALVYLEAWHITRADRFLGTTQPSTNSGFCSSLAALCGGARLLVHSLGGESVGTLFALAREQGLTLLDAGPSVVRLLFALDGARAAFARLRVLRSSGEAILQADIANWRGILPADCHIAHAYASTEAMFGAHWFVPPDYRSAEPRLPAGYPLPDQDYALIDAAGRNVPPGQPGQLVLRSRHVACGEWRDGRCLPGRARPDASLPDPPPAPRGDADPRRPDRSLPDPSASAAEARSGWRILPTGDLLRRDAEGMLRFVSRADRQIKIHGVRVEPAEVESVLRATPGVVDAAVVPQQRANETVLIAYVAAAKRQHRALHALLRDRLRAELPPSMRPAEIVLRERMPYLPGGKIDLLALAGRDPPRVALLRRLWPSRRGSI